MMKYVLGADIGSGSVKLTLLSQEGIIAATAGCEYPTYYPHVGWCEQDPEDWCIAFKTAFTNILADAKISAEQIEGYVDGVVNSDTAKRSEKNKLIENVRKFCVSDVRFFFNSIENTLRLARRAGFDVEDEKGEDGDCYNIHIKINKQKAGDKPLS